MRPQVKPFRTLKKRIVIIITPLPRVPSPQCPMSRLSTTLPREVISILAGTSSSLSTTTSPSRCSGDLLCPFLFFFLLASPVLLILRGEFLLWNSSLPEHYQEVQLHHLPHAPLSLDILLSISLQQSSPPSAKSLSLKYIE
jgi:hypothetical protein